VYQLLQGDMRWLTLLMSLPPTPTRHRVGVWRKLQRMGAIELRGAAWILPETSETTELFQWLVQERFGIKDRRVKSTQDDQELLERGMATFDGLFNVLKQRT
jgi:hypothetical protein